MKKTLKEIFEIYTAESLREIEIKWETVRRDVDEYCADYPAR